MERFSSIYEDLQQDRFSCEEAALILGCSVRHSLRLRARYDDKGLSGLKGRRVGQVTLEAILHIVDPGHDLPLAPSCGSGGDLIWAREAPLDTPMTAGIMGEASNVARTAEKIPLGRIGTAEDIAEAALWRADDNCFITGEVLQANGGRAIPRLI